MKFLSTRPFLGVGIIRDDNTDLKRLIAILIVISVFIWENRHTFLILADNINKAFLWIDAIKQTWRFWRYCILNPFSYLWAGIVYG